MSKKITFTNTYGFDFYPPKPAIKEIPQWYKDTPEYIGGERKIADAKETPHTIKKCMPVFDAITVGYILYTQVDIQVSQLDGMPYYTWVSQDAIEFHPVIQAELHPLQNGTPYPKWVNPYCIKTPPGYSVLITQPFHRESVFTILPGVVDTDKYYAGINFPFVLNDATWEGIIPAGTPLAQVIPFKRESWSHQFGSEKEVEEYNKTFAQLKTLFFNSYKRQFWQRKEYK